MLVNASLRYAWRCPFLITFFSAVPFLLYFHTPNMQNKHAWPDRHTSYEHIHTHTHIHTKCVIKKQGLLTFWISQMDQIKLRCTSATTLSCARANHGLASWVAVVIVKHIKFHQPAPNDFQENFPLSAVSFSNCSNASNHKKACFQNEDACDVWWHQSVVGPRFYDQTNPISFYNVTSDERTAETITHRDLLWYHTIARVLFKFILVVVSCLKLNTKSQVLCIQIFPPSAFSFVQTIVAHTRFPTQRKKKRRNEAQTHWR